MFGELESRLLCNKIANWIGSLREIIRHAGYAAGIQVQSQAKGGRVYCLEALGNAYCHALPRGFRLSRSNVIQQCTTDDRSCTAKHRHSPLQQQRPLPDCDTHPG